MYTRHGSVATAAALEGVFGELLDLLGEDIFGLAIFDVFGVKPRPGG